MKEDVEDTATPVGLVHNRLFILSCFVGKLGAGLWLTIRLLELALIRWAGILGWIDNWVVNGVFLMITIMFFTDCLLLKVVNRADINFVCLFVGISLMLCCST